MSPFTTVSLRLMPTLLAQVDQAAAERGMTRSDWIRAALLDKLQEVQQQAELKALEKRLTTRLDHLQEAIFNHITAEIDSLTQA